MGLAVVAAINLALFRGVMPLLTIPAIAVSLIFLDVALRSGFKTGIRSRGVGEIR